MRNYYTIFGIVFLMTLFISCDKREWINPFDTDIDLNPEDWAPKEFKANVLSNTEIKLTWEQEILPITGFRIQRRTETGSYSQIAEVVSDTTEYTDSVVNAYTENYTYRIKAYAADNFSGWSEVSTTARITFVTIPAGDFTYDSTNQIRTINYTFRIMKYEVTNADYKTFLEEALEKGEITVNNSTIQGFYAGGVHWPESSYEYLDLDDSECQISWNGAVFVIETGYEEHPVVEVTWFGANAFAEFYGMRLPYEEEWEKAARGNSGYTYPWGQNIDASRANYWQSGDPYEQDEWTEFPQTTPVGFFDGGNKQGFQTTDSPSPYNVYDMIGNVWEWTDSWVSAGSSACIRRGGSWSSDVSNLRSWYSYNTFPQNSHDDIGFRCVIFP